jgi:hypothetical protein
MKQVGLAVRLARHRSYVFSPVAQPGVPEAMTAPAIRHNRHVF